MPIVLLLRRQLPALTTPSAPSFVQIGIGTVPVVEIDPRVCGGHADICVVEIGLESAWTVGWVVVPVGSAGHRRARAFVVEGETTRVCFAHFVGDGHAALAVDLRWAAIFLAGHGFVFRVGCLGDGADEAEGEKGGEERLKAGWSHCVWNR